MIFIGPGSRPSNTSGCPARPSVAHPSPKTAGLYRRRRAVANVVPGRRRKNTRRHITMQVTMLARMVNEIRMIMYGMADYRGEIAMAESDRP
jgi:hypothetical protein